MEEDSQKNIAENKISAEKGKMEESKGKNSYLPYIHSDFVALLDVCVVKTPPEKKKKKKTPPANTGGTRDVGLIPGLRRSPGEGNSNPLQYS